MQRIVNRLNKVKHPSSARATDIPISMANLILSVVADRHSSLRTKAVAIFNCSSGILATGASLLEPQSITQIADNQPDPVLAENIKEFGLCCDVVLGGSGCFVEKVFDIALVGPQSQKTRGTDFNGIAAAIKISKVVYALQKSEFLGQIKQIFPNAEIVCHSDILLQCSSHHSKGENRPISFMVLQIEK